MMALASFGSRVFKRDSEFILDRKRSSKAAQSILEWIGAVGLQSGWGSKVDGVLVSVGSRDENCFHKLFWATPSV
jgi:hypothetical protein